MCTSRFVAITARPIRMRVTQAVRRWPWTVWASAHVSNPEVDHGRRVWLRPLIKFGRGFHCLQWRWTTVQCVNQVVNHCAWARVSSHDTTWFRDYGLWLWFWTLEYGLHSSLLYLSTYFLSSPPSFRCAAYHYGVLQPCEGNCRLSSYRMNNQILSHFLLFFPTET